jgi:aspartate racemase
MAGRDKENPTAAEARRRPDLLGVIGGMGPLATVDFLSKLIAVTPAEKDPDHVPVIVSSEPQIPSRPRAYFDPEENSSPLPALRARRDMLMGAGVQCLVMPCNTAHYWYDDLTADCPVPFINIVEATRAELQRRNIGAGVLGLIGTEATLAGELFERPLVGAGYRCVRPDDGIMQSLVRPGIDLVKRHNTTDAEPLFREAVQHLLDRGAAAVILGCTEVPAGLPMADPWVAEKCVDPTAALAMAALEWALGVRRSLVQE